MLIEGSVIAKALREAVAEKGEDFVYTDPSGVKADEYGSAQCAYTDPDGNPSCIVGHVINRIQPSALAKAHFIEWDGSGSVSSFPASVAVQFLDGELDTPVLDGLRMAQAVQDRGMTWGQALKVFEVVADGAFVPAFPTREALEELLEEWEEGDNYE